MIYRKVLTNPPPQFAAWEDAGLRWLAEAESLGGAPTVRVHRVTEVELVLDHLTVVMPTVALAEDFGRRLALTHDAGAAAFGSPPPGWQGDGWFGPASGPIRLSCNSHREWGTFYAAERIAPMLRRGVAQGLWSERADRLPLENVLVRLVAGEFDDDDQPARLHGDLWAGNVVWTAEGVTLIDPCAHGGHRESDLAMLMLFGAPHVDRVCAAYDEIHPLPEGWGERVGLHQLFPVMAHAVLFGGAYAAQAVTLARQYA